MTLKDLSGFPLATLGHSINRPLFRSLQVSPVETYVVAGSLVFGGRTKDAKIIHEEGNGLYDKMIQDLARSYEIPGGEHTESRTESESLTYHLVIFGIKDGKMALLVPRSDDARYSRLPAIQRYLDWRLEERNLEHREQARVAPALG